jgi:hypothetical protein
MSQPEEFCTTCRNVVVRTYREMRQHGTGDRIAFNAALNVLTLRHPERPLKACVSDTAAWIADALES